MRRDPLLCGSLDPRDAIDIIRYNRQFGVEHPDFYPYSGITIFSGPQGSGKTLSAVQYVLRLISAYPKSILVTNVAISGLPDDYQVFDYNGVDSLVNINNGEYGVIYLIDEMHLEFNSLESKSIPIEVFTEISQQRKQRKHIIGTSQLFLRLAKPWREQVSRVIICDCLFGFLQHNIMYDGASILETSDGFVGHPIGNYWWFHNRGLYERYDTFAKIKRLGQIWSSPSSGRTSINIYDSGYVPGLPRSGGKSRFDPRTRRI